MKFQPYFPATLVQTDKCEPQTAQVVKITKDMVELEQDMHENTKIAIDNYKMATQYCADYNKALFKVCLSLVLSIISSVRCLGLFYGFYWYCYYLKSFKSNLWTL